MSKTRSSTARRTAVLLAAFGAVAAVTTGCSGPGGVDLGSDWKGAQTFVLAKVSGLVTVVGINPGKARAESLVAVPSQADDNDVIAPQIVRLADGRWMLSVPRSGGKPDRLYEIDRKEHTLGGSGDTERLRELVPGRTRVAAVAGLPGKRHTGDARSGGRSSVLVRDPGDWTTKREVKVPGTVTMAASDLASDVVCLGSRSGHRTDVSILDLIDGTTRSVSSPSGIDVQQLACPEGRPVLAGSRISEGGRQPAASGSLEVILDRGVKSTVVTAGGGRVDGVEATKTSVVVAVATGGHTELVELDSSDGREIHRAQIPDLPASLGIRHTSSGWLVFSEDSVTRVDLATGKVKTFGLPGELLDF